MSKDAPSLWATLREAVRGTSADLTAIPISRAVVLLAVPTVLETSMESLFAIVDVFVVSRVGPAAVATVGLTESMLSIAYALAMGLGAAATAVVARKTGEKDVDGASRAAVQAIFVALLVASALGVLGALLAPRLLSAMGAAAEVIETGATYTAVMLGGSVTIFLLYVMNAALRAAGDASAAMRSLWLSTILNIVLAPCLVFGIGPVPALGVTGAAIATTVSRGIGVAYQTRVLLRSGGRLAIARRHVALRLGETAELVRLAVPAAMQVLVETASWLGLVRILAGYGSVALAAYTIAMRIAVFALLPPWGFANAAAALVGQNLGAGEPERARRSVEVIARTNVAFLGAVGLVFVVVAPSLVGVFTTEPPIAALGATALRIVALGFAFYAYGMVALQAFNGAGDTRTPMVVNVASFWLFKIPLAYLLAHGLGMGPAGVFIAISAAYTLQSFAGAVLFRRKRWG